MAIFEIQSRPTRRALMNKGKDDLAVLVMQLLDINEKLQTENERLQEKNARYAAEEYNRSIEGEQL